MIPKPLSDRQLFELELEQLKVVELLENEEMLAQRVIDESAGSSRFDSSHQHQSRKRKAQFLDWTFCFL